MAEDTKSGAGRPESKVPTATLQLSLDPVTNKMIETLKSYGRFGVTRQEVIQFILRVWLWENEARLKSGISQSDKPLGQSPNGGDPESL